MEKEKIKEFIKALEEFLQEMETEYEEDNNDKLNNGSHSKEFMKDPE